MRLAPLEKIIPIITFGLGVLITLRVTVWQAGVTANINAIAELILDINKLEELGVTYWSDDRDDRKGGASQSDRILEARIHGALNATRFFDVDGICGVKHQEKFRELDAKLAVLLTGGSFETSNRKADPARISDIIETAHLFRSHLRIVRRDQARAF